VASARRRGFKRRKRELRRKGGHLPKRKTPKKSLSKSRKIPKNGNQKNPRVQQSGSPEKRNHLRKKEPVVRSERKESLKKKKGGNSKRTLNPAHEKERKAGHQ